MPEHKEAEPPPAELADFDLVIELRVRREIERFLA
jgi:hypothetical protein